MRFVSETEFQATFCARRCGARHDFRQLPWRAYARWLLCNAPATIAAHSDAELLLDALTARQALAAVLHFATNLSGLTECFTLYGANEADLNAVLTCPPIKRTFFEDVYDAEKVFSTIPVAWSTKSSGAAWLTWLSNRFRFDGLPEETLNQMRARPERDFVARAAAAILLFRGIRGFTAAAFTLAATSRVRCFSVLDIGLVRGETGAIHDEAARVLLENDGDVVSAILDLISKKCTQRLCLRVWGLGWKAWTFTSWMRIGEHQTGIV